jgi:hypothetical protein
LLIIKKAILALGVIILVIVILLLLYSNNIFIPYPDQFGGTSIPDSSDEPFSSIPDQDLRSYDSEPYPTFPDSSDEPFSSIPDQDLRSYDSEFGG